MATLLERSQLTHRKSNVSEYSGFNRNGGTLIFLGLDYGAQTTPSSAMPLGDSRGTSHKLH